MIYVVKKIFFIGCALLLMLSFSACQLAKDDGLAGQGDRLIGVYVTRKYLDLFDFESYLQDHAPQIMNGGEISVDGQEKYNGRIYAELKSRPLTTEPGDAVEKWDYVFEGLDGIPFFLATVTEPDGEAYKGSSSDGALSDVHVKVGDGDSLEGTIYITPTPGSPETFYINPVYQSGDGEVYLTTGNGMSADMDSEGAAFSTTLDEKRTFTENGKKTEESFTVTVHVAVKYPTESVGVIQMNAENTPVSREDYTPDTLPEKVAVGPDTEYVIVETKVLSPGGKTVSREVFDPGDDHFTSYAAREDGICEAKMVSILWGDTGGPDHDL
jgi:hypothetical protein